MPNDSASGGYLRPTTPAPAEDLELDVLLQGVVVGITGMSGQMVRPREQPMDLVGSTTPRIPNVSEDWCAIGVTLIAPDGGVNAAIIHNPAGQGSDTARRHEIISVMATFYGPHSAKNAATLRDGLAVPQNREELFRQNMALVDIGPIRAVPEITNVAPRRRQDFTFRVRRRVDRVYPVRNLLEAGGSFQAESHTQPWSTES